MFELITENDTISDDIGNTPVKANRIAVRKRLKVIEWSLAVNSNVLWKFDIVRNLCERPMCREFVKHEQV